MHFASVIVLNDCQIAASFVEADGPGNMHWPDFVSLEPIRVACAPFAM